MGIDNLKEKTRLILMSIAEGIEIMENESTFTVTDQLEREIIWDALQQYKDNTPLSQTSLVTDELIERVSRTFSWMR